MSRSLAAREQQALGVQDFLVFSAVPAAAAQTLLGQRVNGAVLTVNGDYYFDIDVSGLGQLEVHLAATLATKTCTSEIYTTYKDETTAKTGLTGDGALVSTVLQTSSTTNLRGERLVRGKLTVAGGAGSVTFTQADYNGN